MPRRDDLALPPVPLFAAGEDKPRVYVCATCGKPPFAEYMDRYLDAEDCLKHIERHCCVPYDCDGCGERLPRDEWRSYTRCVACRTAPPPPEPGLCLGCRIGRRCEAACPGATCDDCYVPLRPEAERHLEVHRAGCEEGRFRGVESAVLRELLRRVGQHPPTCEAARGAACTCGLTAALEAR